MAELAIERLLCSSFSSPANRVTTAGAERRLHSGLSVYPGEEGAVAQMTQYVAEGFGIMKLHPTVQRFYPDDPAVMPLYEQAQKLGLVVFFHGGRAGIEPVRHHDWEVMESAQVWSVLQGNKQKERDCHHSWER